MLEKDKAEAEGGIDAFEKAMMPREYCILHSSEEQKCTAILIYHWVPASERKTFG